MSVRAQLALALAILPLAAGSVGCSVSKRRAGVEPIWREVGAEAFQKGETTMESVLELLGPPSQLLDLETRTVFYYLLEDTSTESLFLVLWNQSDSVVRYDRAIFFFGADGVLTEWAISKKPDADGEREQGE